MKISLIQLKQNSLYDFSSPDRMWTAQESGRLSKEMVEQTLSIMEQCHDTDLVVTTEAVNYPGKGNMDAVADQEYMSAFSAYALERNTYVALGLYTREKGKYYNSLILYDRQGREVTRYHKVHLAGDEQKLLVAGDRYCTVDTDFGRIGLSVCWDMQFPEVARHYALEGCRLVICPTWGWESLYAQARAYENGIWVASAMSVPYATGIEGIRVPSQVISPEGEIRAEAARDRGMALEAEIDLTQPGREHEKRMRDRRPSTYGRLVVCS